jgi:hypothetical protein
MNRYRIVFTKAAAHLRGMLETEILGYSEEDALFRSGINRKDITMIRERYI